MHLFNLIIVFINVKLLYLTLNFIIIFMLFEIQYLTFIIIIKCFVILTHFFMKEVVVRIIDSISFKLI
jgi:hypothetical protein